MRLKLTVVFSLIVVIVGALIYAAAATTSGKASNASQAPRALQAAVVQLSVEGLATERWLAARVNDPAVREPFAAGTPNARGDQATAVVNRIKEAANTALSGIEVSLVMLVDQKGVVVGRNNSTLMRGQDVGSAYPSLKAALEAGTPGSDVWVDRSRNEQLLASFVPVRSEDGKVIGGLVVGSSLNDERLSSASDKTSGEGLAFLVKGASGVELVAKSSKIDPAAIAGLTRSPAAEAIQKTLATGEAVDVPGFGDGVTVKSRALEGYGDGKRAALVAIVSPPKAEASFLFPALGIIAFGIILVVIAAFMLDAYLSKPIAEIEDGLLAIMNGQTNRRIEVEHAELGGLVFRINSLLNQLLGVSEDDTDAEGRPSSAPSAREFKEALAADESVVMSGAATPESASLRTEADDVYYARVFSEYIEAKRSVGDPTDHITQDEFIGRIMASERDLGQKHGKPVRFKVEVKGREVMLIAIPLV